MSDQIDGTVGTADATWLAAEDKENHMNEQWYSDFLHSAAQRWGFDVPTNPPLINDKTSPYPRLPLNEVFTWRDAKQPLHFTTIALGTLNGLYGYTLNFQWATQGHHYDSLLKFCIPFSTRTEALDAAILHLKRADPPHEMHAWIENLTASKQLCLL